MSVKVAYNQGYGAFRLTDQAMELYKTKAEQRGLPVPTKRELEGDTEHRHDPILVEVIEELGDGASPRGSVKLETIPVEFTNYYTIKEYDGDEEVELDVAALLMQKCNGVVARHMTDEQRVNFIDEIVRLSDLASVNFIDDIVRLIDLACDYH